MAETAEDIYRDGSGEPIVFLHGFTGTWHHWRPLLGPLAERFEVIAPTLAGHDGGPPYPADCDVTFEQGADSLEHHLDELGVGDAHLVGNSMGGALALELAKRGRARSVVALAPAGGWTDGDDETRRLARFFARQLRLTKAMGPRLPGILCRPRTRRLALRAGHSKHLYTVSARVDFRMMNRSSESGRPRDGEGRRHCGNHDKCTKRR